MPANSELIEAILDRRLGRNAYEGKGRLQKIEDKIGKLEGVQEKVYALDSLIKTITREIESENGDYFRMLSSDPEAMMRFNEVKCDPAIEKIKLVLDELKRLQERFKRPALRIAFIGRERQGKSTFLKTITGLNDKVIPAYSGGSCTGAVSVIHNNEGSLKVDIEYYSMSEFMAIVQEKVNKFYPENTPVIRRLDDIKALPEVIDTADAEEYIKFRKAYVDHFDEYCGLIGQGTKPYTDEDEIAHHVAQYEEFDEPGEGREETTKEDGRIVYRIFYYKYVAVKNVDIYTQFRVADTQLLELVDTIGIGSAADSAEVEKEMYRVLREDCDAAIDLFRPESIPSYPVEQKKIVDGLWDNLSDRDPAKWIVYVLNRVSSGPLKNMTGVDGVMDMVSDALKIKGKKSPFAWVRDVMGNDLNDVSDKLINPLLDLISASLDTLDENLVKHAEELSMDAYSQCISLIKSANAVISSSASKNQNMLQMFVNNLYPALIGELNRALNLLDEMGYAKQKDQPCHEMEHEYDKIVDNIDLHIPDESDILERFQTGAALTPVVVFQEYIEQLRNDIFVQFESVNTSTLKPLQEKVKTDLIKILYEQGKFDCLPVSKEIEPATTEWLKEIIDNYISAEAYPSLYDALKFILDYQVNIEGLVEYNVTRSLYIIDRTNEEFMEYRGAYSNDFAQNASSVWQELCNRIDPVKRRMKKWFGEFTMIPSHSFYSRVHKFHIKLMTEKGGEQELRDFYIANMGLIWNREFASVGQVQKAFGDWSGRVNDLQEKISRDNFKII